MNRLITCVSSVLISPELLSELYLRQEQTSQRKCILLGSWIKANLFLFHYGFWKCKNSGRMAFFSHPWKQQKKGIHQQFHWFRFPPVTQVDIYFWALFLIIISRFFTWIETTSSVFKILEQFKSKTQFLNFFWLVSVGLEGFVMSLGKIKINWTTNLSLISVQVLKRMFFPSFFRWCTWKRQGISSTE